MKIIFLTLFVAVLSLSIAACDPNSSDDNNANASGKKEATVDGATVSVTGGTFDVGYGPSIT